MLPQGDMTPQESAAGTRSAQDKTAESDEEEPCYVELGMREEGDTRLASVYKPEKRGTLGGAQPKGIYLGTCSSSLPNIAIQTYGIRADLLDGRCRNEDLRSLL